MSAPKVTADQVMAAIHGQTFTVLPDGRTTVCQLTLDNGFTVEGTSACVCKENFDAQMGQSLARERAISEVWKLLGFRLADQLMAMRRGYRYKCAETGEYVSEEYAKKNPDTTMRVAR